MHTLTMVISGLVLLAVFVVGARMIGRGRDGSKPDGAFAFVFVWLLICLVNLAIGVWIAGVSLLVEIGVLAVVFGIPAAAAWLVRRRLG